MPRRTALLSTALLSTAILTALTLPALVANHDAVTLPATPAAYTRLATQLRTGALPDPAAARLIAHILALQSDPSTPWNPDFGDLLESARAAGYVTDGQWQTYLRQALATAISTDARPNIAPLSFRVTLTNPRVGHRSNLYAAMAPATLDTPPFSFPVTRARFTEASVLQGDRFATLADPLPFLNWTHARPGGPGIAAFVPLSPTTRTRLFAAEVRTQDFLLFPPGPHPATLRLRAAVTRNHPPALPTTGHPPDPDAWLLEIDVPVPRLLYRVARPPVSLVTTPALRQAVTRALRNPRITRIDRQLAVHFDADNPPTDLAFRVILRDGPTEYPLGQVIILRGTFVHVAPYLPRPRLPEGARLSQFVDLLLRPDPTAAQPHADARDITQIYGSDLIFPHVPIEGALGLPSAASSSP